MLISKTKSFLFWILIAIGCTPRVVYHPDPIREVKGWVRNLLYQRSFSYEYELKTHRVRINARGDCVLQWGEQLRGQWDYGDTVCDYEYIGIGDREWSKKENKWQVSTRGEESNLYEQIRRIIEFEQFEFLGADKNYAFRFNATLPFLAPDRWREMVGYIEVGKNSYLPELIWVGLPDSSVYWRIRIFNYNHKKSIHPPQCDFRSYQILIDSTIDLAMALRKIKHRLKLLTIDGRVLRDDEKVILRVPSGYQTHELQEFLAPGNTLIYEIAENPLEATHLGYLNKKVSELVYMKQLICGQNMIESVELRFDRISRPYLMIKFKKKLQPVKAIAIEVDSVVIGIATLDSPRNLDRIAVYLDMPYLEISKYRAMLLCPLFPLEVIALTEGSD
ncbi:MAG: hypothetical protein ABIL40_05665 [candidate division WOR-3 bacterium]